MRKFWTPFIAVAALLAVGALARADSLDNPVDRTAPVPLRSCFLAFNSVDDLDVTGAGAIPQIDFDTEVFDQGNDFASDTFTAPVTGRYALSVTVRFTGVTAAADSAFLIITTSNRTYEVEWSDLDDMPAGFNLVIATVADMDATDTATINVQVNGEASNVVDIRGSSVLITYFSGCLIS